MHNKEGRKNGFAKVQFQSSDRAKAVIDDLHNRTMNVLVPGDSKVNSRYIEISLFSDRANKMRYEKSKTSESSASYDGRPAATKDEVLEECRNHMNMPERSELLLSMLGVALSSGAHAYFKNEEQGLKNFLAQFPSEFAIDGDKGSEKVKYLNIHHNIRTPSIFSPGPYNAWMYGCMLINLQGYLDCSGVQYAMTMQQSQFWIPHNGVCGSAPTPFRETVGSDIALGSVLETM